MAAYMIAAPHFYELIYTEGDHSMKVEIDLRDPVPCIYKKVLRTWDPPHQAEHVSDVKKEEIIGRIYDYLVHVKKFKIVDIERAP